MNAMPPARMSASELERLLFHWHRVVSTAPKGWAHDFAVSIATQARRRGWTPSPKQAAMMVRMVGDLFAYGAETGAGDDDPLIEREDRRAPG